LTACLLPSKLPLFHYGASESVIHFRLEAASGTPTYLQLVHQVRRAILEGRLAPGDRLPPAREVVAALAINPNTVLKAYSELEHQGLAFSRPGMGTFIASTAPPPIAKELRRRLRPGLDAWLARTRAAGLDEEAVMALFTSAMTDAYGAAVA
jgi:GntR family transcriptional regulator